MTAKASKKSVATRKPGTARAAVAKPAARATRKSGRRPAVVVNLPAAVPAPVDAPAAPARASSKSPVTPDQRFAMIREAAYLLAEKDGFRGDPNAYWHAAEKQVIARLKS